MTRLTLTLLVLAALGAAGCTTTASESQYFGKTDPPDGQILRYISGSEPESLDPQISTGQPEARFYMAIYDGLTEIHPQTAQPIPGIAERWEANSDNTEFIFHLRHNARWSNGDPITAHDFVYSFRRGLRPELAARSAYMSYDILNAQAFNESGVFVQDPQTKEFVTDPEASGRRLVLPGDAQERDKLVQARNLKELVQGKQVVPVRAEDIGVDAVDDYTLRLRLAQSVPFVAGLMTHQFFRPVPRKTIEQYGDAWTRPEHIVTSGPFTLKTWKPYDRLVVVRSPTYWDAANVHLDQITFYPLEDQTTMMNLYKAGEVDAVYNHTVPAAWIDYIRPLKDYMDAPELANEYYQVNTTVPPMNDRRVRKAFNMAIDKVALSHYKRVTKPLTSFVPEGVFPDYPRPPGDPFDPKRARELLAEAGYKDPAGNYDASRFPIGEVALIYNTSENNRQVAEFVQAQWKQNLALTVPIKNMEWKTFLAARAALQYKGFARSGWVGDYMDPFTFLNIFSTPRGDNGTGWWDKKYVDLLIGANRQTDPATRDRMMARAEEMLLDGQAVIPLYSNATNWVKKPYVKGMYANPVTLHAWKFVYIEHDPAKWDIGTPMLTTN
jgi:ABC-type oligopeptide transport system substrate-binding subunit